MELLLKLASVVLEIIILIIQWRRRGYIRARSTQAIRRRAEADWWWDLRLRLGTIC